MYGSRGAMYGSGGVSDGYEVGSKRPRMMDSSNPYFAVSGGGGGTAGLQSYGYGGGFPGGASNLQTFPIVRLRGLPFNCDDMDVFRFFAGLDVVDILLIHKNGRFTGEAFVLFATPMQAEFALQRDHQNMGRRYVEVFRCKKLDYYHAIAAEVGYEGCYDQSEYQPPPPPLARSKKPVAADNGEQMEFTEMLKLRGLPYSATKADIVEFFGEYGLTENNVHIACRPDGKATGEAYVEFGSVEEAKRATSKDKMMIGSRYVEIFPSTPEEARRAEYRSRQ
ncbi:hypothetical protein QJS10_CPB11g02155 [Acorus calamus]|uniref:RRM domain-containing protein n=1 Tax=Acorus calamus TaxID=4465 RepID=A0AAV9DWA9_ACOCL|nr:hypothetical protein QJS10_CPB11g02155 [Acorus calamus]